MTSTMGECQNMFEEDRISQLPDYLIRVMGFLPARDAARTCVLSSKWRYIWADHPHPSLVLDYHFWNDIQQNRLPNKLDIDYANIVSSILLHHVGHIKRLVIDVSVIGSILHSTIDIWLSSLCRRGLKELDLESSYKNLYQLPSWVFSTSTLTHLSLGCCIIKAKCFTNIQSLTLCDVTLDSSVLLTTPLLTSLTLKRCSFINLDDLDIFAPRLASLTLKDNEYLNLKPFFTCTDIDYAYLFSSNIGRFVDGESQNLVKLLATWPRISQLVMDDICFKCLTTGSIPSILQLNNLRYLALYDFSMVSGLIAWILCILKNSPLLHTFEICFGNLNFEVDDIGDEAVIHADDLRMDQLRTIKMIYFKASRNEFIFAKMLLKCAPVLEKMLIEDNIYLLDPDERIHILKKLLLLQRAFPKPEISFRPVFQTML